MNDMSVKRAALDAPEPVDALEAVLLLEQVFRVSPTFEDLDRYLTPEFCGHTSPEVVRIARQLLQACLTEDTGLPLSFFVTHEPHSRVVYPDKVEEVCRADAYASKLVRRGSPMGPYIDWEAYAADCVNDAHIVEVPGFGNPYLVYIL